MLNRHNKLIIRLFWICCLTIVANGTFAQHIGGTDSTTLLRTDSVPQVDTLVKDTAFFITDTILTDSTTQLTDTTAVADSLAAQLPPPPDTISVLDIVHNYQIDARLVDDTLLLKPMIDAFGLDYAASARKCKEAIRNVSQIIHDLEQTLSLQDSVVWLDSSTVIADYLTIYRQRLQHLSLAATRLERHYQTLEKERLAEENRIAEEKARIEAERRQLRRDAKADSIRTCISSMHQTIASACEGTKNDSKAKAKELKDIYYAYLTIYNRFELTTNRADNRIIHALETLNSFQQHLMDSVLGPHSYPIQVNNFKSELKSRCGKEYSDIFKSYNKLFKQITVPVSFNTLKEYQEYAQKYKDILAIQEMYNYCIDLRKQISATSNIITSLYSKKYKEISSSYKYMVETVSMTPAFTTIEGGIHFIEQLTTFQEVQQRYIHNYERLETIQRRGDTIAISCPKKEQYLLSAYDELYQKTNFVPSFKTLGGADIYKQGLDDFETLQQAYFTIIKLRSTITQNEETILGTKGVDRTLSKGYKTLKELVEFTPTFSTIADSETFIKTLQDFILTQNKFLSAIDGQRSIETNANTIKTLGRSYSNITKAYNRLIKTYQYNEEIYSIENLLSYTLLQQQTIGVQQHFIEIFDSPKCQDINNSLKRISDPENIKLIMNIQ